jgi:hypothetical protein
MLRIPQLFSERKMRPPRRFSLRLSLRSILLYILLDGVLETIPTPTSLSALGSVSRVKGLIGLYPIIPTGDPTLLYPPLSTRYTHPGISRAITCITRASAPIGV